MQTLDMIDVSHHNGYRYDRIDWVRVADGNPEIKAVMTKCVDGYFMYGKHIDPTFHDNWKAIADIGKNRAAYAYMRYDWDQPGLKIIRPTAVQQINLMGREAQFDSDDYPVLDIEQSLAQLSYMSMARVRRRVTESIEYAFEKFGRVMVYTGGWWWNQVFPKSIAPDMNKYPLYNAYYYNLPKRWGNNLVANLSPGKVNGWDKVTIHQYTDKGVVSGIPSQVDLNRYLGDVPMDEFFGRTQEEPPKPPAPPIPPPPAGNIVEITSGEEVIVRAK